jgi:hypothetical protein
MLLGGSDRLGEQRLARPQAVGVFVFSFVFSSSRDATLRLI